MNNHIIIVDSDHPITGDSRTLAINISKGIQIQVETDGDESFIDISIEELENLVTNCNKILEFINEK